MDPESLRRCMSFGFSEKRSESFIGQCNSFSARVLYNFVYVRTGLFANDFVGTCFGA
jgi:hypothetical protein